MNANTEPPPDPLMAEKARQYDIAIEIIEWILATYRGNPSLHAIAPHLVNLRTWYDVQHNLGIRQVPGHNEKESNGSH